MPAIPSDLLSAVATEGGGRLALVIGAGCSIEAPTAIPLAGELSREAYRKLVHEGVLSEGDCPEPSNLAALAALVFERTQSQGPLIRQFPLDRMRTARANEGYRTLIALMLEGVVSHALSLNFDLAPQNAAAELGAVITVIDRPEGIPMTRTVVHLHGSVNSATDEWVLRAEMINEGWRARWQEVVARQILAAPNVVFAGLGSAAPVLSETVAMIATAVGKNKTFFQIDTSDHATNAFAQELQIPRDRYIQGSWCEVMPLLAKHLAEEQVQSLIKTGAGIIMANGGSEDDVQAFCRIANSLNDVSLLAMGLFRAHAQLDLRSRYLPRTEPDEEWMALPLKVLADLTSRTGVNASPLSAGLWQLNRDHRPYARILIATGRGSRRLSALESAIRALSRSIAELTGWGPDLVLVGSLVPDPAQENTGAPPDIVAGDESAADIITGPPGPCILSIDSPSVVRDAQDWLNAE